jgi:hypothetical protein
MAVGEILETAFAVEQGFVGGEWRGSGCNWLLVVAVRLAAMPEERV